jgi:hypothetical protein
MLRKNLTIKSRMFWTQTIFEIIIPILFGAGLGFGARESLKEKEDGDLQNEFLEIAGVFGVCGTFGAEAFASTLGFILNEMVADKESRMRESLKIMSLNRWSYGLSFFITQGIFAIFTSCFLFSSYILFLSSGEIGI